MTETEGDRTGVVFDAAGNQGRHDGAARATTGTSHVPVYVAIDPLTGEVYVSDRPTGTIYIYDRDGAYQRELTLAEPRAGLAAAGPRLRRGRHPLRDRPVGPVPEGPGDRPDGERRPDDRRDRDSSPSRTVSPSTTAGNVYVTDSNNGRLLVFDGDGQRARPRSAAARARATSGLPRGLGDRQAGPRLRRRHDAARASSSSGPPATTAAASSTSGSSAARASPTASSSSRTASRSTRAAACTWPTRSTTACRSGATEAPGTTAGR